MKTLQQAGIFVPLLVAQDLEVAGEWHPTKNTGVNRDEIKVNSSYRAWWRCKKNNKHIWRSQVRARALDNHGCPYCSGRKVLPEDSIKTLHPHLAKEFHPTKNEGLKPSELGPASNKKVWWQCSRDSSHEWKAQVYARVQNTCKCQECRKFDRSLAGKSPEIAAEWHPTKNGDLNPEMVPNRSEASVWWKCAKNEAHEWKVMVKTRTRKNQGCPHCNVDPIVVAAPRSKGKRKTILETHPHVLEYWHHEKNLGVDPKVVDPRNAENRLVEMQTGSVA